ncbi:unnamed protein product [Dovyalis caffra]|uniref:Alpha N-terminal protein methyltransferase 1 n=1 Tax=Dovyalis caffra TaxID=77055 RepID=A0AAV1RDR9_9ROSI|nr:unnamed protein product [Dovyalis caffra]
MEVVGTDFDVRVEASIDGALSGYGHENDANVKGSEGFLRTILVEVFVEGGIDRHLVAFDHGFGIGRITKNLFYKGNHMASDKHKATNFYYVPFREFTLDVGRYDVIWVQWCIGHLTDNDFVPFFKRDKISLKPSGFFIPKESLAEVDLCWTKKIEASLSLIHTSRSSLVGASLLAVLVNRAVSGIAPVADASRSLVVVYDCRCILQIGVAAESVNNEALTIDAAKLMQGSLYQAAIKSASQLLAEKTVPKDDSLLILYAESYLANLSLYPGRSELPFLPSNTQEAVRGGLSEEKVNRGSFEMVWLYLMLTYEDQLHGFKDGVVSEILEPSFVLPASCVTSGGTICCCKNIPGKANWRGLGHSFSLPSEHFLEINWENMLFLNCQLRLQPGDAF